MQYGIDSGSDLGTELRAWIDQRRSLVTTYGLVVEALIAARDVGLISPFLTECVCLDMDRSLYAFESPDELLARIARSTK